MTQKSTAIVVAKEVDGVEMGVLADGTPFLTGRGLAKACGVAPSAIIKQADAWKQGNRNSALAKSLVEAGYNEDLLYVPIEGGGIRVHAYTDSVATLIIEYYALETGSAQAKQIYRVLAREGLREFIYRATGFQARTALPASWKDFHDRLLLTTYPAGYFSIYREIADFLLRAIQVGLVLDNSNVLDISVGQVWGNYWRDGNLDEAYGPRQRYAHNYPEDYPQAASNPQDIWVYPVEALGAFRRWLDEVYIPEKFPNYLNGRVKKRVLERATADRLLAAVTPAKLSAPDDEEPE